MLIEIDASACCGDSLCVRACPSRVLVMEAGKAHVQEEGKSCIRCGHCVSVCPKGAVHFSGDSSLSFDEAGAGLSELERAVRTRRSIRWYQSRQVPREELAAALDIARYAPTARNLQQVAYTAVDNPDTLRTVAEMTARWLLTDPVRARAGQAFFDGQDTVLRGAPGLVVAHAPGNFAFSPQDCSAAMTTLELILHGRGLGACWAGYVIGASQPSNELRELLGVAEDRRIFAGLLYGYPAEHYLRVPGRKPASLHWA